jgi:hypothetical protein
MLKLKKAKPIGSQVIVTKNLYDWDDFQEGILIHKRGDLKSYQQVVAIGDDVKWVKPGDFVEVNFYKYAVLKEDAASVKATYDNPIVGFRLNEIDMVDKKNKEYSCILIDQRDIRYIMEDFEESHCENSTTISVDGPKQLILPKGVHV